ncbi:D-aminopeptidase [Ruminiclostridium hungatei]|uniref:D-aminopeptidase n=1 Tax=Ruminiclostridium hungatei TaxID=48256 RepID=A0A1V4SRD4_RUMHU|nr:M55 family metallopeptidase [Ruminiclostridium hungatei]OPX46005.1 D-aminopeptidase [Ruminiclostridium hungatei]
MRVLICCDIEGASSVNDYRQIAPFWGNKGYEDCIRAITSDVNSAIRGLKRAGAISIDIFDGHGDGGNLRQDMIEGDAVIISKDVPSLAKCKYDAVLLIGQHACAGTADGFLSHTGGTDYTLNVNGKYIGEVANGAWLFGSYNTPAIMVTGDDAAIREAKALLPGIEGVIVKKSLNRMETMCLPIEETSKDIEEKAFNSLKRLNNLKPFIIEPPIKLEIEFINPGMAQMMQFYVPKCNYKEDNVVSYIADEYEDIFKATMMANLIASTFFTQSIMGEAYQINGVAEFLQNKLIERLENWAIKKSPFPIVKY